MTYKDATAPFTFYVVVKEPLQDCSSVNAATAESVDQTSLGKAGSKAGKANLLGNGSVARGSSSGGTITDKLNSVGNLTQLSLI